ncbi:unnamed protein product [Cunninghamella blakesleeana]
MKQQLITCFEIYKHTHNRQITTVNGILGDQNYGYLMSSITNDYYTKFTNRIADDLPIWTTIYISMRLQMEVQSQYRSKPISLFYQ